MIYKFTVDKYVKCWIRKEVAVNADSIKEACINVLQTDTSKGSVIIDNTTEEIQNVDGNSIEIYTKDKNDPILVL